MAAETVYDLAAPAPAHRLWLEYSTGLENSRSTYGELDLALGDSGRLLLGAGLSDVQGASERVDLYTYTVGFNTPWGEPFEAGALYEFWGNTDALWTHTFSLPLGWNTADWFFGLRPGYTAIALQVRRFGRPRQTYETASQFVEGSLIHFGLSPWRLRLQGALHAYDDDLGRLQHPLARYLLSDVTLVLGYGFPRSRLGAEAMRDFPWGWLGASFERTIVESDGSRLDVTSLKAGLRLHARLSLHLQGGRIDSEYGSDYNYLRLGTDIGF